MSSSKQFEAKGGASLSRRTLSRRTLVGAAGVTAATLAAGKAFAQATPPPVGPPSTITQPRAISAATARRRPTSPTPTSCRSIRVSTRSRSPTAPSSGCGPARCGRKGRRGTRRGAISCGATFPTTGNCAGSRMTGG